MNTRSFYTWFKISLVIPIALGVAFLSGCFSRPIKISGQDIYVTDSNHNRVVHFTSMTGNGWETLGTSGNGKLHFNRPWGITGVTNPLFAPHPPLTVTGIYVADNMNGQIIRMNDMSGNGWTKFSIPTTPPNPPPRPRGIAIHGGNIYTLVETSAGAINLIRLGSSGALAETVTGNMIITPNHPLGLGQTAGLDGLRMISASLNGGNNNLYVTTYNSIIELTTLTPDTNGHIPATECCFNSTAPVFDTPHGLALDGNRIYVADTKHHRIVRIEDMSGTGMVALGKVDQATNTPISGNGVKEFNWPTAVFVHSTGIYVVDSRNNRIVRMDDISGTGWTTFSGPPNDGFSLPLDIFVASRER